MNETRTNRELAQESCSHGVQGAKNSAIQRCTVFNSTITRPALSVATAVGVGVEFRIRWFMPGFVLYASAARMFSRGLGRFRLFSRLFFCRTSLVSWRP